MSDQAFNERVAFECPFCQGRAAVVEPAGVMHTMPPCATFVKLEPLDYLHAVNVELGNHGS